jgi:dinuclear metal center YbgI/SA1388 family protein
MNPALSDISDFIDALLNIENVADSPNAFNGLQLANEGLVAKLGAAVDAGEPTLRMAVAAGVDLLIVHHGLFWTPLQPLTGAAYRKVSMAMRANMAIYSAHLPLDVHPKFGNNALLAKALGLGATEPFFHGENGQWVGLRAEVSMPLGKLVAQLEKVVAGPVKVFRGGPERVASVGIVTGGAGGEIHKAAMEGVDTLITGEAPHWAAIAAEELGVNMLLGGHYATETFGVKALAEHVAGKLGLPWQFIDYPTGL